MQMKKNPERLRILHIGLKLGLLQYSVNHKKYWVFVIKKKAGLFDLKRKIKSQSSPRIPQGT